MIWTLYRLICVVMMEPILLLITKNEKGPTGDFRLRGRHIRKALKDQKESKQKAKGQH